MEGGAAGYVDIVARLLEATFAVVRKGSGPFGEATAETRHAFPWEEAMAAGLETLRLPAAGVLGDDATGTRCRARGTFGVEAAMPSITPRTGSADGRRS